MFSNSNSMSPADFAAMSGGCGDGMFWWLIIILFLFCGNGWGYGNNNQEQVDTDFGALQRQINAATDNLQGRITSNTNQIQGITYGLANLGYNQLDQVNSLDKSIMNSTYDISTQLNNIASNQQSNCCTTQNNINTGFANMQYQLATDTCAINTNIATAIRDVIDNDNANYRALESRLTQMELSGKDEQIANLQTQLSDMKVIENNNAQTAMFTNALNAAVQQIKPAPVPAFNVPTPFYYGYGSSCSGCGA